MHVEDMSQHLPMVPLHAPSVMLREYVLFRNCMQKWKLELNSNNTLYSNFCHWEKYCCDITQQTICSLASWRISLPCSTPYIFTRTLIHIYTDHAKQACSSMAGLTRKLLSLSPSQFGTS